jgi:hypothetical protein
MVAVSAAISSGCENPTPAPPPPPPPVHQTSARDCPPDHRLPLLVQAETADEIPYLAQIAACTNDSLSETYLRNSSALVWRLVTTNGSVSTTPSEAGLAQAAFRGIYPSAALEPGSWQVVYATPAVVRWYADPVASGLFAKLQDAEKKTIDKAVAWSPKLFAKGSRAQAFAKCAASAWSIAGKVNAIRDAEDVATQLEQAMGIGKQGSSCFSALQAADAEDVRAQRIREPVLPVIVSEGQAVRIKVAQGPVADAWVVASENIIKLVKRV